MPAEQMQPASRLLLQASLVATALALAVILLGAYVRLSDAGLGCPDWPGCYGHLDVPSGSAEIADANAAYPTRPVEPAKAWKEMVHRYLAGALGLAILGIALWSWRYGRSAAFWTPLPWLLLGLVVFQAMLGMWTVTLLVKPAVVTAHLLGGLATISLLWLLALGTGGLMRREIPRGNDRALRPFVLAALGILLLQIALGGWTSSNYAALGCIEFPTCHSGDWWPPTDFREGFVLWRGLGVDYQYGVLEAEARTAIHLAHRLGALLTAVVLGGLTFRLHRAATPAVRRMGWVLGMLLLLQLGLGISNVLAHLPLSVAVAHNGGAALLLLILITLAWLLTPLPRRS